MGTNPNSVVGTCIRDNGNIQTTRYSFILTCRPFAVSETSGHLRTCYLVLGSMPVDHTIKYVILDTSGIH